MAQALPTTPPAGYDQGGLYPAGAITSVSYYSPSQGTNDTMYVYLPPGYTTSRKYPVIYGYPGISAGADTIFAGWCVDAGGLADNLIGQGKIQPVIIVAIDDNNGDVQADTLNVIIPYIDSHYSTYADADHRGLYGYSWGGGYTFNIGCGNLNTFRYLSPSSAAPDKAGDSSLFPNGGAEAKRVMKLLLISCGNADYLGLYGSSEGAHNYCVSNGIPHAWWPVNGGNHDAGSVWRPAMWNFLQMADAAGISDPPRTRSAYSQIEAEDFDTHVGGSSESCSEGGSDVGSIVNGNYAVYRNVDFSNGATNFQARVASATSGGNIEVHLDGTNGTLVGTCAVSGTGGWQTWVTQSCSVSGVTGIHNLYLVFTGGSGYLFNVNWWRFGGPSSPVSIPSVPSGLVATAGIERAALRWTASSTATSYNVKRATTSGGTYTTVANVAGTNYTDRGVIGGTTYYYVVSALNVGGESADSGQASVTPTVNVPSPWLTRDIGAVGLAGSASFTNGVFTMVGSGADIGSAADAFRFVHVTTNGDCTIIARVASLDGYINPWSKAGVMIRESLATNAANVFVGVTTGNGVIWQYRSSTGGVTSTNNTTGPSAPYWVKLVRSGNTFTAYRSADGVSWTLQGTTTITMASTVYVGLAITSHNLYTLCAATFDHVTGPGWTPPPVLAPTGLVATAGIEQVALRWMASSSATSYSVKRGTTSGGPYTTIATVTTTNYTDTFVIGRTTYYYVVSALSNAAGESGNSAQVSATPILNVPLPWMTRDIGTVGLSGGAGYTNGVFTVTASGDDIWNSADAFRFVYVTNSGNFSIVARVVSVQNIDGWSKAGVMIRESLDANAANAFVAVTPGNGVTFQYRLSTGGGCNFNGAGGVSAPYWVKLVRSGTTFTGYYSPNGTSWTQLGSATLTNISTAYIGLAVTAHNNSSLCTAKFDNVSVPGWPPSLLALNATAVSSSQINLVWNTLTNATSYNVKRSLTDGGPYTPIASGVTATNYQDSGLAGGTMYYYVVGAVVSGSATPDSTQVAAATLSPTLGSLVHRYSFSETGGASIGDSVGGPIWNGTLPGGGTFSSGQLTLASASSQYAQLPAGIVGTLSNFTIVAWVRLNSTTNWSRILDFGSGTTVNMFLTPQNGSDGHVRFAITTNGGGSEQQINCTSTMSAGVWYQVAVTLNGNTGILYLNGLPVGTNNAMTLRPSSLGGTVNNYLGRSQYPDPYLDGQIDEFRIYNAGLSSAEIAATSALGPNQQLSTNSPAMNMAISGANLTLSWPLAHAGFTLQSCTNLVLGNWVNVPSPAPQLLGNQWQVTLPLSGNVNSIFYRLSK
jgi:enterochelin esterase-like enzyme/fibronectin type 3 domain-containing protein/regulation of enolase protein 1 (concanavalin A-like superfamily)